MSEDYWDGATWAYRNVFTQTNAAGGLMKIDFTPGEGNEFLALSAKAENSGTNGVVISRVDEDGNRDAIFVSVTAAATVQGAMPQSLAGSGTDGVIVDSTDPHTRIFSGSDHLAVEQNAAGVQNDTFTISIRLRLRGAIPTVSKARSTNPGDVTVGTPTIERVL